jgi:hypothetical protein
VVAKHKIYFVNVTNVHVYKLLATILNYTQYYIK